jgi:hypothetical protein
VPLRRRRSDGPRQQLELAALTSDEKEAGRQRAAAGGRAWVKYWTQRLEAHGWTSSCPDMGNNGHTRAEPTVRTAGGGPGRGTTRRSTKAGRSCGGLLRGCQCSAMLGLRRAVVWQAVGGLHRNQQRGLVGAGQWREVGRASAAAWALLTGAACQPLLFRVRYKSAGAAERND